MNKYHKKTQKTPKKSPHFLPYIKQTKDQTTITEEQKTTTNDFFQDVKTKTKNNFIFNDINSSQKIQYDDYFNNINNFNIIKSNILNKNIRISSVNIEKNNNKNTKLFFNRNYKLKSIEKSMIKSNSNINIMNKNKTLTVINIPSSSINNNNNYMINKNQNLEKSSSLQKIFYENKNDISKNNNIKDNLENNKCNYLYLKYSGFDNSRNVVKNKKIITINSHKVIESLKSVSMPDDLYGQKLIDILEHRINSGNSGNYRKMKFQKAESSQSCKDYLNEINEKKYNNFGCNKKENEKKRFSSTFLTDIYDDFLLPDKDNKFNYTIHKIFLSNILNKICKKMIEIRDIKNKVITRKEIRDEFCNELNILRDALGRNKNINIINNNIYNINSDTNIINIDLSNNNSILNEISTIEELQENNFNEIHTTNDDKDKDKQYLTSNMLNLVNDSKEFHNHFTDIKNYKFESNDASKKLENIHSKYKELSKKNNVKLLSLIKEKLKLKNNDTTLHDSCSNVYLNKSKKGKEKETKNKKNNKKIDLFNTNYIPSLLEKNYFSDEEKLSNVDKFILNTKKLRYTFNLNDTALNNARNYSYDLEGNIHNSFNLKPKLNIVEFEDILQDIENNYALKSNTYGNIAKMKSLREIIHFFLRKKRNINRLKFDNDILGKYIAMLIPYKYVKNRGKKNKKKKKSGKSRKKLMKNIIDEISKKLHKRIRIKGGRVLNTDAKDYKTKHYGTEGNVIDRKQFMHLSDNDLSNNNVLYTDNIFLEIETNSSEYTDIPSVDSEIEEMIRKKREKDKDKEIEEEEGIYSIKREKKKNGEFIIKNKEEEKMKEKIKEKIKEKEKIKNLKKSLIKNSDNISKEQLNNSNDSSILKNDDTKLPKNENIENLSKVFLDKYLKTNEKGELNRTAKSGYFRGNSIIRSNTLRLSKRVNPTNGVNNNNNINKRNRKSGILDIKLNVDYFFNKNKQRNYKRNSINNFNIKTGHSKGVNEIVNVNNKNNDDDKKKKSKNIDIKELNLKQKKILENIIEEDSKETKRKRSERDKKRKKTRKKTKKRTRKSMPSFDRKDIKIITDKEKDENKDKDKDKDNDKNQNQSQSKDEMTSDYEEYSLNNNNDNDIEISSDNKTNLVPVITPRYEDENIDNINDDKNKCNDDMIEKPNDAEKDKNDNMIEKVEKETIKEKEEEINEEKEIIETKEKMNESDEKEDKMNKSFCYKRVKFLLEELEFKERKKNKHKTIYFLEAYRSKINEIINLKKTEDEFEEKERKRKKFKKRKRPKNIKGAKKLFMENNEEIDNKKEEIKETEEVKKPMRWEEKFDLLKEYIQDLKNMNDEQFNYDAIRFLKENDKNDYYEQLKISKVDRINRYKTFLMKNGIKSINFNKNYKPHLIFTPGCIFNTGELFK